MILDVENLGPDSIREARRHYGEKGYLRMTGLEASVTPRFRDILARQLELDGQGMTELLRADGPPFDFTHDEREAVSRIDTSPELSNALLEELGDLLLALIGPLVHVSSTFHGQFKGGETTAVSRGGVIEDYMEVRRPYLLHQDFSGALIPTSPSGVTLWVGVNTADDWKLRVYPGTHKLGLLCHEWMELGDRRLGPLGAPVEIPATEGDAVLFNALLLHGTGESGPARRVSCDIRFFPLCGWLPSAVHEIADQPLDALRAARDSTKDETLLAPLFESAAYLGEDWAIDRAAAHSPLNWAAYVNALLAIDGEAAKEHLARFVNEELGIDPPSAYIEKFHGRPFSQDTLDRAQAQVARA